LFLQQDNIYLKNQFFLLLQMERNFYRICYYIPHIEFDGGHSYLRGKHRTYKYSQPLSRTCDYEVTHDVPLDRVDGVIKALKPGAYIKWIMMYPRDFDLITNPNNYIFFGRRSREEISEREKFIANLAEEANCKNIKKIQL
jgi:hypothetical protein